MSDPNFQLLVERVERLKERVTDDWQALTEASHILRQITLDCDPREREPTPVSLETRTAAESWLVAHDPELRMAGHRSTEG